MSNMLKHDKLYRSKSYIIEICKVRHDNNLDCKGCCIQQKYCDRIKAAEQVDRPSDILEF